jgi:predicted  nucleic acid-binding Zn-ribbon protein
MQNKVHEIYQSKKEVKVSCNQFYQSRTGSSLKNYQSRISTFQEYKATDHQNIHSLEQRLTDLKQNSSQKRDKAAELNQQINKLKQEAKLESSLIRSQMRSRSSLSAYSARSGRSQGQSPSGRLSEMKAHE